MRDHEFEEQKIIAEQEARREKQQEAIDNAREFANDVLKAAGQALDTRAATVIHKAASPAGAVELAANLRAAANGYGSV